MTGEHSPTTSARQAVVALEEALRQYEHLGPAKMERADLNRIRDAARLVLTAQSAESAVEAVARAIQNIVVDDGRTGVTWTDRHRPQAPIRETRIAQARAALLAASLFGTVERGVTAEMLYRALRSVRKNLPENCRTAFSIINDALKQADAALRPLRSAGEG